MAETNGTTKSPVEVQFNYLKSNFFRVIHVDGAMGNVTPQRKVFISFYSERVSLPDFTRNKVNDDGKLGNVLESKTSSPGIVREVEVGVSIDVEVARSLAVFLLQMASQAEGLESEQTEVQDG